MLLRTQESPLWITHNKYGPVTDDCIGDPRIRAFDSKEECGQLLGEGEQAVRYAPDPTVVIEPDEALRGLMERSGSVTSQDKLVCFLYDLLANYVTPGTIERILQRNTESDVTFTNGWLAKYAEDIAKRLTGPAESPSENPDA